MAEPYDLLDGRYTADHWDQNTLADGNEMSDGCIGPIVSAINDVSQESSQAIDDEIKRAKEAEEKLQDQIDSLEAATDVIAVFGNHADFVAVSGGTGVLSALTDQDVVKVLEDEEVGESQVYWQCTIEDDNITWANIGSLAPYYSKGDINSFSANLSGTISSTYLSANNTAVIQGDNIKLEFDRDNPYVTIATQEDVVFNNITASTGNIEDLTANNLYSDVAEITDATITGLTTTDFTATDATITNLTATNLTSTTAEITNLTTTALETDSLVVEELTATTGTFTNITSTNVTSDNFSGISAKIDNVSAKNLSSNSGYFDYISATTATGTSAKFTEISSKDFRTISASGQSAKFDVVSATNLTATSASGDTLSYNNLSGSIISGAGETANIDELITNAEDGSVANAWLNANVKNYISAITTANNTNVSSNVSYTTGNSAQTATIKLTAYKTIPSATNSYLSSADSNFVISLAVDPDLVNSASSGWSASDWLNKNTTGNSAKYALSAESAAKAEHTQDSITAQGHDYTTTTFNLSSFSLSAGNGIKFVTDTTTLGIDISAEGTNNLINKIGGSALSAQVLTGGRCISIDSNNAINLSSNIDFKTNGGQQKTDISSNYINLYSFVNGSNESYNVDVKANYVSAAITRTAPLHSFTGSAPWDDIIHAANGDFVNINITATNISSTNITGTNISGDLFESYWVMSPGSTGLQHTVLFNGNQVSSVQNNWGATRTAQATWYDIVNAGKGQFTNIIADSYYCSAVNGGVTSHITIDGNGIQMQGAGQGGGASWTLDEKEMNYSFQSTQGTATIKQIVDTSTGTWVSSNSSITALVSASTIGSETGVLYLV